MSQMITGMGVLDLDAHLCAEVERLALAARSDPALLATPVRIVVPSDQLFQPGTAQLQPQAAQILDPIAAQLRTVFPRQRIGIEGNTDNAQLYGGSVATSHQLASAQAAAVLDLLTRRSGMLPQQLFTVSQGSNRPRQSNDTAAGRAANRRVEFVIYPETY